MALCHACRAMFVITILYWSVERLTGKKTGVTGYGGSCLQSPNLEEEADGNSVVWRFPLFRRLRQEDHTCLAVESQPGQRGEKPPQNKQYQWAEERIRNISLPMRHFTISACFVFSLVRIKPRASYMLNHWLCHWATLESLQAFVIHFLYTRDDFTSLTTLKSSKKKQNTNCKLISLLY